MFGSGLTEWRNLFRLAVALTFVAATRSSNRNFPNKKQQSRGRRREIFIGKGLKMEKTFPGWNLSVSVWRCHCFWGAKKKEEGVGEVRMLAVCSQNLYSQNISIRAQLKQLHFTNKMYDFRDVFTIFVEESVSFTDCKRWTSWATVWDAINLVASEEKDSNGNKMQPGDRLHQRTKSSWVFKSNHTLITE